MASALRVGTLGAARITPMALIRPARELEYVSVDAVAARNADRAAAFAKKHRIGRVHTDYDALVADPEINAIYNPLPNSHHAEWTIKAVRAGKHVLCEKPFASNADEAEMVHRAVADSGCVVMEAFHYRYHPLAERIIALRESGELGQVQRVDTAMCIPLPLPNDIRYRLDLAGGATMDTGCYAIHMLRSFAGEEPQVLRAQARLASEGVDRWMTAEVQFPSGAEGRITCSLWSSTLLRIRAHIIGDQGEVQVTNPVAPQLFHSLKWRKNGGPWQKERFPKRATYTYQLERFADAVHNGTAFPTTTADAVRNMRAIDAVYQAAGMQPRPSRA